MKNIRLLDCTMRDGGYVNDWNFGHSVITGTYKRLDSAGTDFIEVGFLDDRRLFDVNRTIVPNTDCFNVIFSGVARKHAIPVAMIDYGTCALENIGDSSSTFIDGIRVIFKKEKIEQALPYCKAIKEKGYKLFIQAISITEYSELDILEYVSKINEINPYAFSIVDTYGLLDPIKLTKYFTLIDKYLNPEVRIGYHAHNNFQLAFSNTMRFLALETERELVADSTVYGMGKSAGNCATELISMHMNQNYGKSYDVCQFLEVLDTDLMSIYQKTYWGYKYNYFISAMQNCHPNYVQFLLDKKTLTVSAINEILETIPEMKKLTYDNNYIESAYLHYQNNSIDDTVAIDELAGDFRNRSVVILGPGSSISSNKDVINNYILKEDALVISVNFVPEDFKCDYVFVSNSKRYGKMADFSGKKALSTKLIITSNITPFDYKPSYILNYQSLLQRGRQNSDNALLLCITAMLEIGIYKVALAGFDGFTHNAIDYYDISYSFSGNEQYRIKDNEKTIDGLIALASEMKIEFLTESLYQRGLK